MDGPHHHMNILDAVDRFPQWNLHETRDFLSIRAEYDQTFMETKRNKVLWEMISQKMKERGHNRSAEQCKHKWKNLVTRFKACETTDSEVPKQQFPFYGEMQTIFTARVQRVMWTEDGDEAAKKAALMFSSDDEDENEESDGEKGGGTTGGSKKKRRVLKSAGTSGGGSSSGAGNLTSGLKEVLEEFMKQQLHMEMQWQRATEAREEERRRREIEWRRTMEAMESERIMLEQQWREREEARRMREEARAQNKDALISAILEKIRRDGL